ncbi:quinon protein alcohol dehydrogenase-like superfamily [Mycena galopus ATCC 62051]|nr:quinon protein alcohol dehydrogenase-like superfamily [Mycena galopus ATCC 62051]
MEPTATANILSAGIARAAELQSILDSLGKYSKFLETFLALGLAASEVNSIAKAVFASVDQIYKLLQEQHKCDADIAALLQDMIDVLACIADVKQFAKSSQLTQAMEEVNLIVCATGNFITQYSAQSSKSRILSLTLGIKTREELDKLTNRFLSFRSKFDRGLAVQSGMTIAMMEEQLKSLLDCSMQDRQLQSLRLRAPEIKQGPEPCMPGTRVDILDSILDWANDLDGPNVFWLHGYPGTGKSAIAMTVTAQLLKSGRLASHFFFKREEFLSQTPKALWCSVAYDLADKYPEIRSKVILALESGGVDPQVTSYEDIFDKLIFKSLQNPLSVPTGRMPILVIDALDECGGLKESRSYQTQVLKALSRWKHMPPQVKLFVTSRNEKNIHSVLGSMGSQCKVLEVGERTTSASHLDIEKYLRQGFDDIQSEYPSLPYPWPTPQDLKLLTDAAAGLFIWASTVLKLVGDHQPQTELEQIIQALKEEQQNEEHDMNQLDHLYQSLLVSKFSSTNNVEAFKKVAGAILVAQIPLASEDMHALLPSLTPENLAFVCKQMNSVLDSESGLRFVHQSFVDFLVKLPDGSPFNHKKAEHEQRMTCACFQSMAKQLRFNITGVESSYFRNDMIPGLAQKVSNHLYYACRFWSTHLQSVVEKESLLADISRFMHTQLLFWLEVLSARCVTGIASAALRALYRWFPVNCELKEDVQDAIRFVRGFGHPIAMSIPHIYVSALGFSPATSRTRIRYCGSGLMTLRLKSGGSLSWPATDAVLNGHQAGVASVAFSPDGTRIVSGSYDNTVCVWDTETQAQIGAPLEGHTSAVTSVAFSPDGTCIISGSADNTVCVWDAKTWTQIRAPLKGHMSVVVSVAFSPDGTRIVSGSYDHTVRVWDAETQAQIGAPLGGHTSRVMSVVFSPDGTCIVSGSEDNTVRVWNTETQAQIGAPLEGHTNTVTSVAFSPDGTCIVSGSGDTTVCVWDTETQTRIGAPLKGHRSGVTSVAFSPDGAHIVSASYDKTVRVWDTETQTEIGGPLEGHTSIVMSVAFSPDGTHIVSGSYDKTVRVWDTETQTQIAAPLEGHTGEVMSVAFSPDGTHIISGSADKIVCGGDPETQTQIRVALEGHTNTVWSVAFSPDGNHIVSGSEDCTMCVWDAETWTQIGAPLEGHTYAVASVAFSPTGTCIVSGSSDNTVCMWDAETQAQIGAPLEGHTSGVLSVAFSPDGTHIVSGSNDKTVRVWDAETQTQIRAPLEGHTSGVRSVAFSPDGTRIVSGSEDNTVRVWDTETQTPMGAPLESHTGMVTSVAFSPDGTRIVSGSNDTTVRVWDAETQIQIRAPLEGHTSGVTSVAFSPDGTCIVSGSEDNTVRVWDTETQTPMGAPLESHTGMVTSVAFSPDGTRIVSGSEDNTVRVWDTETQTPIGAPLESHTSMVTSVAFSPDGPRIASGSSNNTLGVWDAKTQTLTLDEQAQHDPIPGRCHSHLVAPPFTSCPSVPHHPHGAMNVTLAEPSKLTSSVHVQQDGWIVGPCGELILWVPYHLMGFLFRPNLLGILGNPPMVTFDTSIFHHGDQWTRCNTGQVALSDK